MTSHEIFLCETALRVLDSAGTQGVNREAWMAQVDIMAGQPLTTAEQERAHPVLDGERVGAVLP